MLTPRPYQQEALDALDEYMRTKAGNPCVVIPTAGGKSIIMAWQIEGWLAGYPPLRVCILAHRKELVEQNSEEFAGLKALASFGVYAAGMKRRDTDEQIIFASIDSVHNKAGEFPPFDLIIIDEAHRIPTAGNGKYLKFISACRAFNQRLKVVGFTATPYRMGVGPICHADHILNEVCYEANVADLIADGFICPLRSKVGHVKLDLDGLRKNSGGDYVMKALSERVDTTDVVASTIQEAMKILIAEGRKSVIFFCIDVEHCQHVSDELRKYGVEAPVVTGKTRPAERNRIAEAFKAGRYRAICNVNVYTEGFNAKRVDAVVLLRPTLSKGMFVQMVGRGLRLHESKQDCLVLDFASCITEHGPIDCIDAGETRVVECRGDGCGDVFSRAVKKCPNCGWEIPKREVEAQEKADEAVKRMHAQKASSRAIISEPEEFQVDAVTVSRHRKKGQISDGTQPAKPDTLLVSYRCGMMMFREWIALDHDGYAKEKAQTWWARRFGGATQDAPTLDDALQDMFLAQTLNEQTQAVTAIKTGRHSKILGYRLTRDHGQYSKA